MLRTILEVPLVWFAAGLAGGWLLQRKPAWARRFAVLDGACSIAIFCVVAGLNACTAGFLVAFGANVLSIAAAHYNGQQMYHAVGGAQLYTLVYGPYTYLVYEPLLHGLHALTAVKIEMLGVDLLAVASLLVLMRRHLAWPGALALTGLGASVLLAVPAGILGIRGDVWAVLALTLALLAVEARQWLFAAIGVGMLCGFAVDLKATLAIEASLLVLLLWRRHGSKAALVATLAAVVVAAAPFTSASISWQNYVAWLRLSGHRDFFPSLLTGNVLFAAMLFLPALLVPNRKSFGRWPERLLFALAVLAAITVGAESGGGAWHLWPLLPFVLLWTAQQLAQREAPRLTAALALAALVVSARYGARAIRIELPHATRAARTLERDEMSELIVLAQSYSSTRVEMAPGASMDSGADDLRFFLIESGEPNEIDMVAAGEALKTDPLLINPVVTTVAGCGTFWAVPHGEIPFSTRNNNETRATYPQVFPEPVRAAFLTGHHLGLRGVFYDLWTTASPHGLQSTSCE